MSLSLFGQSHAIGFSREVTCRLGALTSLTGVLCVVVVGRPWIICCYIVERLISCGALSLEFLRFHGSPNVRCQIFFLIGGIGWDAFISHLEFSFIVFDMVYLEGTQSADV